MARDFDEWFSKFRRTIHGYDYFVDFEKVYKNVDEVKISLNILNSLIGSRNIEEDFDKIIREYPEVIKVLPILIAVRLNKISKGLIVWEDKEIIIDFKKRMNTVEEYKEFMRKTGLFELISNHMISSLVDYVTGVEVGLDSNARKNRGGSDMENLVEEYICAAGFEEGITYFKQINLKDLERKTGLDLSKLSNNGKTVKRFDFAILSKNCTYAIETNFYGSGGDSSGGSKLNETARSYKTLTLESKEIDKFKFVWITDGADWASAKNNLRETFDVLDTIYSLDDLDKGILKTFHDA